MRYLFVLLLLVLIGCGGQERSKNGFYSLRKDSTVDIIAKTYLLSAGEYNGNYVLC